MEQQNTEIANQDTEKGSSDLFQPYQDQNIPITQELEQGYLI